jgi:cation:H+ antiporter
VIAEWRRLCGVMRRSTPIVVGSNLFNLLAVLGASAVVAPQGLEVPRAALDLDLPAALLVTLVALPALATGLILARWEGALLLAGYAGYVSVVVLTGTAHPAAAPARAWFFAGLAGAAVLLIAVALWRRARGTQQRR